MVLLNVLLGTDEAFLLILVVLLGALVAGVTLSKGLGALLVVVALVIIFLGASVILLGALVALTLRGASVVDLFGRLLPFSAILFGILGACLFSLGKSYGIFFRRVSSWVRDVLSEKDESARLFRKLLPPEFVR